MLEIILDALLDAVKVLPFLFCAYLLIEYLEHKAGDRLTEKIRRVGAAGPFLGALLGVVPQCGFSVTAANFYAGRMISAGTLLAVFLSTSDEALLILMAQPDAWANVGKLLGAKLLIAFLVGFGVDLFWKGFGGRQKEEAFEGMCRHCHCEKGNIWLSALNHTVKIFVFLFLINVVLGLGFHYIGEEAIRRLFLTHSVFQPFLTALIGFIPNCAASVLITELFLSGALSFGSAVAGLCTGAGLGLAVLLRVNRRPKENIRILLVLYGAAVVSGLLLNLLGL